jgi:S1-C subfamily serine protease
VDAKRGWIATNAHVSSHSAANLSVTFRDGKSMKATQVFIDPYLDLAILRFDPRSAPMPAAEAALACDALPSTGHPVGAYGHPWGYKFTGTRGIISAITSRLGPEMIQTDAPINSGNSGGALIDLETGAVVGINTAKAVRKGKEANGIGFAVPMTHACTVIDLLKAGRDPSPPGPFVQFAFDTGEEPSLAIARVNLPIDAISLRAGDTIVAVGDQPVATEGELFNALRGHLESAEIAVNRDGTLVTLKGRWPAAPQILAREGFFVAGALFSDSYLTMGTLSGGGPPVMVHHVDPGSDAESAELEAYDFLISINGAAVSSLDNLQELVSRAEAAGKDLDMVVMRLSTNDSLVEYHRRTIPSQPSKKVAVRPNAQGSMVLR